MQNEHSKDSFQRELDKIDPNTLSKGKLYREEVFWRDHGPWLEEKGYILRPRLQPYWTASWLQDTSQSWGLSEDATCSPIIRLLYATRVSDGVQVVMKMISPSREPHESAIFRLFSSDPLASYPQNHCIPIIEVLEFPEEEDLIILVMPMLTDYTFLEFSTVGEVVEMFHQLFESIWFLHKNNVAHCDCKQDNFMMDGLPLFVSPPHPHDLRQTLDYARDVKYTTRTLQPIKYYVIDFGLSCKFDSDTPAEGKRVPPNFGGQKRFVPEFKTKGLCDPFRVDVFCLGNFIKNTFLVGESRQRNLEFMHPLIDRMIHNNPSQRPTMNEVLQDFDVIRSKLSWWQLRAPVADAPVLRRPFRSIYHWATQVQHLARRIPSIPTP